MCSTYHWRRNGKTETTTRRQQKVGYNLVVPAIYLFLTVGISVCKYVGWEAAHRVHCRRISGLCAEFSNSSPMFHVSCGELSAGGAIHQACGAESESESDTSSLHSSLSTPSNSLAISSLLGPGFLNTSACRNASVHIGLPAPATSTGRRWICFVTAVVVCVLGWESVMAGAARGRASWAEGLGWVRLDSAVDGERRCS